MPAHFAGRSLRCLLAGFAVLLCLLALAPAGAATRAEPSGEVAHAAFFAMSSIRAHPDPGQEATRFTVSLSDVPTGNRPELRWELILGRPGSGDTSAATPRACENARLPGGRRLHAGELEWTSHGTSFLWYLGGGGADCRGTVAVVAENEYEHCSARLTVAGMQRESSSGSSAVCALGGFSIGPSTLPVPAGLLKDDTSLGSELPRLTAELRRGTISSGAAATLLARFLARQSSSFASLFAPVFGCGFARLFDPLAGAAAGLDEQLARLRDGAASSPPALAADATELGTAAARARACERSAADPAGAPPRAVEAIERFSLSARALARPGAIAGAGRLRAALERLENGLATTLSAEFPAVFGIPYGNLLGSVARVSSTLTLAEQRARAGHAGAAADALAAAAAPAAAIRRGLVHHQKQVVRAENANA